LEGMAYRLVPIKSKAGRGFTDAGRVNTTTLPDKLLNVFPNHARVDVINNPDRKQKPVYPYLWGGINDKRVYHPEETSRMFAHIKSIYLRTASQLAAEGNIEKAEQIHDKLLEIFNPDITPYILIGNHNHIQYSFTQADALLRLGTPTATEKGLKMIERMLDELIVTFRWFEKCDERTIVAIQDENINLCLITLSNIDRMISDSQRMLFMDKFEQLTMTKTLTALATQASSEIDFYLKKGVDSQRDLVDQFHQLRQYREFAEMTNDNILNNNIVRILEAKINMISASDPQTGRAFRDYFLGEEEGE